MKLLFSIIFLIITNNVINSQIIKLLPNVVKAKQEEKVRLVNMVLKNLELPINDTTEIKFQSAFWAMEYLTFKPIQALSKVKYALNNFNNHSEFFNNDLLELIYTNYKIELKKELTFLLKNSLLTPKQFAICAEYLFRIDHNLSKYIITNINDSKRDSSFIESLIIKSLSDRIQLKKQNKYFGDELISAFIKDSFLVNETVIISFQNTNRNYPGIAIIKKPNGEILTLNDTTFYVPQLARSLANLPFYISNGNTPQGVFRINGFANSTNNSIGPTTNFQLCMPFECDIKTFFNFPVTDTITRFDFYDKFYPTSLQKLYNYPLYESAIAAQCGRTEIIAHGTTVNPNYYNNSSYTGFTPTAGCLCTKEYWNYNNGLRTYSDQQKLIDAYQSIGAEKGFLIVLDIINENRAVNINDVKKLITK